MKGGEGKGGVGVDSPGGRAALSVDINRRAISGSFHDDLIRGDVRPVVSKCILARQRLIFSSLHPNIDATIES